LANARSAFTIASSDDDEGTGAWTNAMTQRAAGAAARIDFMTPIFPGQIAVVNVRGTSCIQATEATEETVTVSPQKQQSKQRTRSGSADCAHSVV